MNKGLKLRHTRWTVDGGRPFTKVLAFLLLFTGWSCSEPAAGDKATLNQQPRAIPAAQSTAGEVVPLKLDKSTIRWKGTKLAGTGKHEGTLGVKEGQLRMEEGQLTGGYVVADMHDLKITDIPPHETVPIRNLTNHLNSDFDVEQFPTSRFEILQVSKQAGGQLGLAGRLTIKGITRPISVIAQPHLAPEMGQYFTTEFSFNRFDWGIGEDGSWLEKKLVDEDIHLSIELWTETR